MPLRTAIGAMAIAFYMVLTLAAMNDIIALKFHISLNATTWIGRIGMVVLPAIVYYITYRWCVGCSAATGRCSSTASRPASSSGCRTAPTSSLHQPLGPVDEHGHPIRWSTRAPPCPSG